MPYLTGTNTASYTAGNTLLLQAAVRMREIMHGTRYGLAAEATPLSYSSVMLRTGQT